MTMEPENIPPVPSPAIARPTIKALLEGAVAQTRELQTEAELANTNKMTEGLTQAQILQWRTEMCI